VLKLKYYLKKIVKYQKSLSFEKETDSILEFGNKATTTTVTVETDILENDEEALTSPLSLLKKIQARSQQLREEHVSKAEPLAEEDEDSEPVKKSLPKRFRYEAKAKRAKTNRLNSKNAKKSFQQTKKRKSKI